jgi:hypothetical protein
MTQAANLGALGTNATSTGALASAGLPTGCVLQVVSTSKTDTYSTADAAFTSVPGLSVSITPKSSSSKILILVNMTLGISSDNTSQTRLLRNATPIDIGAAAGSRTQASAGNYAGSSALVYQIANQNISFLDSPATTSSTTYYVQVRPETSASTLYINRDGNDGDIAARGRYASNITLMEVAG